MSRSAKLIGVILISIAMLSFVSWPLLRKLLIKKANAELVQRTKLLVERNSQLQAGWDTAMEDDVLSFAEAKMLVERAGEKIESEK